MGHDSWPDISPVNPVSIRIKEIANTLMHNSRGISAYELMVELCYQKPPTTMSDFVFISRVKKSSINHNTTI